MTNYYKYPRTPHLPWSRSATVDDIMLDSLTWFQGREVVVTEKLDGECTTMYPDLIHARSIDSGYHESRSMVKKLHGEIKYLIPKGWRLCGENVYAKHSVFYESLEGYFYLFSVWNELNQCLDWDQTVEMAQTLNIPVPRQMYRGLWDRNKIQSIQFDSQFVEGYVVRTVEGFHFSDFQKHVAKNVRKGHIQTDQHWMKSDIVPNRLKR